MVQMGPLRPAERIALRVCRERFGMHDAWGKYDGRWERDQWGRAFREAADGSRLIVTPNGVTVAGVFYGVPNEVGTALADEDADMVTAAAQAHACRVSDELAKAFGATPVGDVPGRVLTDAEVAAFDRQQEELARDAARTGAASPSPWAAFTDDERAIAEAQAEDEADAAKADHAAGDHGFLPLFGTPQPSAAELRRGLRCFLVKTLMDNGFAQASTVIEQARLLEAFIEEKPDNGPST